MHQCFLLLILLALSPFPAVAHNGALAIAVPVKGITIDGDLSDWPQDMRRYPILLPEYGDAPKDSDDFQASFRLGYSAAENVLWLAVEIEDESFVLAPTGGSWNNQDGCEVYVDLAHQEQDSPAVQYTLFGQQRTTLGPGADQDFAVELRQEGKRRWYEWRIGVGRMRLHAGQVVGLDVVVEDQDQDGSFTWMAWGREGAKIASPDRRGDALLVGEESRLGRLRPTVRWTDTGERISHARVRVQSLSSDKLWLQVEADQRGICEIELPEGRYRAGVVGRAAKEQAFAVQARSATQIALGVGPPQGKVQPAGSGKGRWQSFGRAEGLPSVFITSILQDRQGALWFGTFSGVSRYDGTQFQTFTTQDGLANNQVWAIAQDREGKMWFGTVGGVSWYDGKQFQTFTTQDGLASNLLIAIAQDREGNLWFGTYGGGVSRYDGTHFQSFTAQDGLVNNSMGAILEDRQGKLWFGTAGGLSRYDGKAFQSFTTQEGLANNIVGPILQDQQGTLWFGTAGGVSRYDGKQFQSFTTQDGLVNNAVGAILQDQQGDLWFGTGGGVSRYDRQQFQTFTTQDGLASNFVRSILEDREGNLWFGTEGGVSRYEGYHLKTFTVADGLPTDRVSHLLEDQQGNLWFSVENQGVSRFDGRSFTRFSTEDGLASDQVMSIAQDREGRLWFGTNHGVSRFDGKHFQTFTAQDGLASNQVTAIGQDQQGDLWFGTGGGMSRYDGTHFQTFSFQDSLNLNMVTAIAQDSEGSLFFGTQLGGVYHYDGQHWTLLTTADGLPDNGISTIAQDREGKLFFGTNRGLSQYDGQHFVTYTTAEGLVHNGVSSIAADAEGRLWLGTGGGVVQYDGKVFQGLRGRDGLPSEAVYQVLPSRTGEVWVATQEGLSRYRPGRVVPAIQLTDVIADQRWGPVTEIALPTSQDYLAFEFQGRSLSTRPEGMAYVCRLAGYDTDWRSAYTERVEYADLPRGEYLFEVKAVDRDLNYSVPAAVKVNVHLPYGQFALYGLLGVLGLAVVWQAGRLVQRNQKLREANTAMSSANKELFSVNRQLAQTLEEKEQAQELLVRSESMAAIGTLVAGVAHELNNPLGAAYSLVQTVQEMVEEDTAEQLQQEKEEIVGHLAFSRKELNRAKEIVAALLGLSRQSQDYTEAVEMNTVVQDALRVLYNQYKKYEVNIAEEYGEGLPSVQGNFAQLGQVCMNLIKNAIEALKDQEGQIVLKTYREGEQVVFECADTGPGMSEAVRQDIFKPFFTTKAPGEGTGLGLYICHQTVEKHRGSIEVESEVGKGTVFRVRLPAERA